MIDYCIVAVFLIGTLIYGMIRGRGVKTLLDYSLGNRKITRLALTASIAASIIGGGSTIGEAAQIYTLGVIILVGSICEFLKYVILANWIIPKMVNKECITIGEFVGHYYGRAGRIITGLAGFILCAAAIGAQIAAMGYVTHYFLGVSPTVGIVIAFGSLVVYSSFGGFKSVVATDVVQFFVLIVSIPMVAVFALKMVGGVEALWSAVPKNKLDFFPSVDVSLKYWLVHLSFIIPSFDPDLSQRLFASNDVRKLKKSFLLSGFTKIPLAIVLVIIGLSASVLFPNIEPHTALLHLIDVILPVGFKGFAICGLLAVVISTADSLLNSGSILLIHDVYKPLARKKLSNNQELRLVRILTLLVGVSAMAIAVYWKAIFDMVRFGYVIWSPLVIIPIIAVIIGKIPSKRAYIIASVVTLIFISLWSYFQDILIIEPLYPGLLVNGLILFLVDRKNLNIIPNKILSSTASRIRIPDFAGAINLLRLRAESKAPQYTMWGIVVGSFIMISHIYFSQHLPESIVVYSYFLLIIIGLLFCFVLIFSDTKWNKAATFLKPLIWFISLTFCLPFLSSIYFLINGYNIASVFNISISSILFLVVSDWLLALILYPVGIICAYIYSHLFLQKILLANADDFFVLSIGLTVILSVISLAFLRVQSKIEKNRMSTLEALSGAIAHELRTPLAIIGNANNTFIRQLNEAVNLLYSKQLLVGQYSEILQSLQNNALLINQSNKNANNVIDMHLAKIKKTRNFSLSDISAKNLVQQSIDEYHFEHDEKAMVRCIQGEDFLIKGDEISLKHVFFNLFKNAIYHVKKSGKENFKDTITITLIPGSSYNRVHFKDYGTGIAADDIYLLFEKFYSKTKYGTGLGLYYCKSTIEDLGGTIECNSQLGVYTEFVLTFLAME